MESHLIRHEQCPKCKEQGRDTSKNNLAIYSDGHQYCYACKYVVRANKITSFKNKETTKDEAPTVVLPLDSTTQLPRVAQEWLERYEFDHNTINNNHIMWSDRFKKLIFPYFINGELVGWQGRVFDPQEKEKRKWFSQGALDSFIYTRGKDSPAIVLTESIISAIKVGRWQKSSPIYGSVISTKRWSALSHLTDHVILWLDPDKKKEAIKQADTGRLFIPKVSVILSDKKPKDYTYTEIKDIINAHT